MTLSSIAICSRALLKIGANTIASFDDGTTEAEIAANLYPSIRDALLSSYPWNFATAQIQLAKLSAEPIADYQSAFQLPADFLRALSAGLDGRGRGVEYRINERRLYANADSIILTYIFRPDEQIFPPFFDQILIARLASEFCIPITESTSRAQMLRKQANEDFKMAKSIDSLQDQPGRIEDFSLINARA